MGFTSMLLFLFFSRRAWPILFSRRDWANTSYMVVEQLATISAMWCGDWIDHTRFPTSIPKIFNLYFKMNPFAFGRAVKLCIETCFLLNLLSVSLPLYSLKGNYFKCTDVDSTSSPSKHAYTIGYMITHFCQATSFWLSVKRVYVEF